MECSRLQGWDFSVEGVGVTPGAPGTLMLGSVCVCPVHTPVRPEQCRLAFLRKKVHSILLVAPENPKSQLRGCRIWHLSS